MKLDKFAMKSKGIYLTLLIGLLPIFNAYSQVYELDFFKDVPVVSTESMKLIASVLDKQYQKAKLNPFLYSTSRASLEVVYRYYDIDDDGKLDKINPTTGKIYNSEDSSDLRINDELLFNLEFNDNGKLVIPDTLIVISYREEVQKDRTILQKGMIAFELVLDSSVKLLLDKVILSKIASIDINSVTNEKEAVGVIIPFFIHFRQKPPKKYEGMVSKNGDIKEYLIEHYLKGSAEYNMIIDKLGTETELELYKRGQFKFLIVDSIYSYFIDVNEARGMMYSSQPTEFETHSISIQSFAGEGKKYKK